MCRQAEIIDAKQAHIDRDLAKPLHRITDRQTARFPHDPRRFRDRLDHAGLIVGQHEAQHRCAEHLVIPVRDLIRQLIKIQRTVWRYIGRLNSCTRVRRRFCNRFVLNSRDEEGTVAIKSCDNPVNSQIVSLGPAPGQHNVFGPTANHPTNGRSGTLQHAPGSASGCVHRRRIGRAHIPNVEHRLARFRPYRGGCIVVGIDHVGDIQTSGRFCRCRKICFLQLRWLMTAPFPRDQRV